MKTPKDAKPAAPPETPPATTPTPTKGKKAGKAPPPVALPAGSPTPEQIADFAKSVDKRAKEILNHPEFILGMNDPQVARKSKFIHEGDAGELLGELLERLDNPQEFMVITIKREKGKKGRVSTNLDFGLHNMSAAAIPARFRRMAVIAEQQYQSSSDI